MGAACSSAPRLETLQRPLELLVLGDGAWPDAALLAFLTRHSWLSSSSCTLQRRRLPRNFHPRTLPSITVSVHPPTHRRSALSNHSMPSMTPPPPPPHLSLQPIRRSSSARVAPSASSSSSSSSSYYPGPPPAPLLSFALGSSQHTARFHMCPDYQPTSRRRASTLQQQTRPASHLRRSSRSHVALPTVSGPLYSSHALDGCVVFVSTRDALSAGSALVGGIRPLLKRVGRAGGVGGRKDSIGSVMPFVIVGLDEGGGGKSGGRDGHWEGSLGDEEGRALAADCGACGFVRVDVESGKGMAEALKSLVLHVENERGEQQRPQRMDYSKNSTYASC